MRNGLSKLHRQPGGGVEGALVFVEGKEVGGTGEAAVATWSTSTVWCGRWGGEETTDNTRPSFMLADEGIDGTGHARAVVCVLCHPFFHGHSPAAGAACRRHGGFQPGDGAAALLHCDGLASGQTFGHGGRQTGEVQYCSYASGSGIWRMVQRALLGRRSLDSRNASRRAIHRVTLPAGRWPQLAASWRKRCRQAAPPTTRRRPRWQRYSDSGRAQFRENCP